MASTGRAFDPRKRAKKLHAHGVIECEADFYIYVLYDDFFGCPVLLIFTRANAKQAFLDAEARGDPLKFGSREGNDERDTADGYILTPEQLCARIIPFTPGGKWEKTGLGFRAEMDAWCYLQERGEVIPEWDKQKQFRGIDLYFTATGTDRRMKVQVKSRGADKRFPGIFVQRAESNKNKRKS